MNVLITGAGLLGIHVAKCLADRGAKVTIIDIKPNELYCQMILGDRRNSIVIQDGSILDESFLEFIIAKNNISYVVHTAALFDRQEHYCDDLLEVNLIGTELLLKKSVQHRIRKFIFISTVSVYDFRKRPSAEVEEDYSTNPSSGCIYGATKALGEALGDYFVKKHQLNFVSVRFCNLYGPNRPTEPQQKAIWQQVFDRAIGEGIINLHEPQLRKDQYLFVKDAAEAIKQILTAKQLNHDIYNVASKELYTMEDFIRIAEQNVAHLKVVGSEVSSAGYEYRMNCQRAIQDFGFNPLTTLEQGFLIYRDFMTLSRHKG